MRLSIGENLEQALSDFELLKKMEIDLSAVTRQLEGEGVEKFKQAHASLLEIIEKRRINFKHGLNGLASQVKTSLQQATADGAVQRLYAHDPT